jgi:hypothetical protein
MRGPCAGDIAKFCKDVEQGGGHVAKCLKAHEDSLSQMCRSSMKEAKANLREVSEACAEDTQKFCQDVKPGGGRIARCLQQNEKELSSECQESLAMIKRSAN